MEAYLHAARLILAGQDIYAVPSRPIEMGGLYYIYPPVLAVLFIPFTFIPVEAAIVLWTIINVALLGWIINAFYVAMTGSPLSALPNESRWIIIFFSLLPASRFILHHLFYGQSNILIMALAVLGLRQIRKNSPFPGGLLCGFSVALKTITFPFAFWFFLQRNVRALTGLVAGFAAALLLPAAVLGFSANWNYLVFWFKDIVLYGDLTQAKVPLSVNVSIQAQVYRFFGDGIAFTYGGVPRYLTLFRIPDTALRMAENALVLAMFLMMAVYWYKFRGSRELVSNWGGVALTFSLLPVFTPFAQKHYLVLLLPTFIYIVHVWYRLQLEDKWFRGLVIGSFVLLFFTNEEFCGELLGGILAGAGCIAWGGLLASAAVFRAGTRLSLRHFPDKLVDAPRRKQ
jgi:alpha-1,2-mannosyltransferase